MTGPNATADAERVWRRPMKGRVVNGVVCAVAAIAYVLIVGSLAASSPREENLARTAATYAVICGLVVIPAIAVSVINIRGLRADDATARMSLRRDALIAAGSAGVLLVVGVACVVVGGATENAILLGLYALLMPAFALGLAASTALGLKRSAVGVQPR